MAGTFTRQNHGFHIPSRRQRSAEIGHAHLLAPLVVGFAVLIYACSAIAQNNVVGQWSPVMTWPYEAIHAHVLPTGKVMFWTRGDRSEERRVGKGCRIRV